MTDASPQLPAIATPKPANEAERLEALRRYNILDTPAEAAFDRITALAARLFDIPIALVSLVDESRAWFKSSYGFDLPEVQRDNTICSFALLCDDVLVIPNAQDDERFCCNPFVQSEAGLRFYAGAPLLTPEGYNLGTLCLLDTAPRERFTDAQKATLKDLAAMVIDELELRRAARQVAQVDKALLEITQGVSTTTGEAFFTTLVQHFTKVLGVDYACISLLKDDQPTAVKTIAFCGQGEILDNVDYTLQGTPCAEVIRQQTLCCFPQGLQTLFPDDRFLIELGIESYAATPCVDASGNVLGLLSLMDRHPLDNLQLVETLLPIFALRLAAELERQQTEALRQQTQSHLENLVTQRTAELSHANQQLQLEIAQRQHAQASLQQEQELLRVLLDSLQAGIVACDANGTLTLFNRAAREFHGLSEQPLPPEQWANYYDLYQPDGKTRLLTQEIPLFRALQGEMVAHVEMVIAPKQGTARTLLASGQAIVDANGRHQGAVAVMHDITDRKQSEAELLISDIALQQMPDAILLTDLEGTIQRWLGNAEAIFGYTAAEAIGQPVEFLHHPDCADQMMAQILESIQTTGVFSGELSCLRKDGSDVVIETTAKPVYDKAGQPIFLISINKDISDRKQMDAERARLMRQQVREQTARLKAESDQRRSAFLAEVSAVLSSSLDYERTLASVADLVVPFFADWCAIDLLHSAQSLQRVAVAHRDPEKVKFAWELHQKYPTPMNAPHGVPHVLRTGQSEMAIDIPDELLTEAARDDEHLRILRELSLRSYIVAPLIARGQILGAIIMVTAESERRYMPSDLAMAEDIAHRAAIAIDNARLYREAQTARQAAERFAHRTNALQQITAALSQALTPQQVAEVVMQQGIGALGARAGSIALLDEQRTLLTVLKTVGYPASMVEQWTSFPLTSKVPLAETAHSGEPQFIHINDTFFANYPHLVEGLSMTGSCALASLPLEAEGRLIGVMGLSFGTPQAFHSDDRSFMLTLAGQCAQAIARAHLYEAERNARNAAELANRTKDEFLAVLSHELRSPLNPILGWVKLLRSNKLNATQTAQALETIERNAKLQTQLIEDLLDVSRILRGKLSLEVVAVNLPEVVKAAIETVQLAAEAKSIHIHTEFAPHLGQVLGDAARLQQVVWNLLTNAIKFTPPEGRVDVRLELVECSSENVSGSNRVNGWMSQSSLAHPSSDSPAHSPRYTYAQLTVQDTGRGISPDFLQHVFEYFRQADYSTTRSFGGLGLGLAIVRHLVELHGGTVEADSAGEGQGATFTVCLPLLNHQRDEQPSAPVPVVAHTSQRLQGVRVLLVDDEADARDLATFILHQAGAQVTHAPSATTALDLLAHRSFDVLISDIGMPEMDGYMLMHQIRMLPPEQGGNLPAIALTAYARGQDQQQVRAAGFQQHVAKPVEPDTLIEAIANLLPC